MKIHSFQNTLAFKKQLVAEGNIINKDKPTPCQIYEILPDEDELYFENLKPFKDVYNQVCGTAFCLRFRGTVTW
jgi:hypothetical protein